MRPLFSSQKNQSSKVKRRLIALAPHWLQEGFSEFLVSDIIEASHKFILNFFSKRQPKL
jgi:hypothetical protein